MEVAVDSPPLVRRYRVERDKDPAVDCRATVPKVLLEPQVVVLTVHELDYGWMSETVRPTVPGCSFH